MDYDAFGANDGEDAGPKITIREVSAVPAIGGVGGHEVDSGRPRINRFDFDFQTLRLPSPTPYGA